ncbi:glycosyltransferase family 4 protein [Pannonibacter carbonis]|uniref:glycosyltransferase family 4 protein n=1 Tax=Pannonibacter carbonis TaxID=2067569 RepID=UPI000D10455C|nr:glycosyltransferase family 4 protein [Pannonibacter carbonis]
MSKSITFAYPGDLNLNTGGYGYDRRVIAGLGEAGWTVSSLGLGSGFPRPSDNVRREAERRLSALPDGALVLIDGLAFGVLDDWAAREGERLHIVALVHHPLAFETDLPLTEQDRLLKCESRALSFVRHVVVTSPMTARDLKATFGVPRGRLTVALPGTDPAPLSPCNGNPAHIVCVASLIPRKGHDILVAALARIRDLPWHATLAGSPDLSPQTATELRHQIERLGLTDRIALTGECRDARALMATADIFALASRFEGYGMVFAEALSQGLPIVACRAGAIPDVVPESAGLLVPVDDIDAFAGALKALIVDKPLHARMTAAARQAGTDLPDWTRTTEIISNTLAALQ